MRIRELKWKGLHIWPPQWAELEPGRMEQWSLQGVQILPLTELIKIDAAYEGGRISGLLLSNESYLQSLYRKLKENIGKPLGEVADLDVNL